MYALISAAISDNKNASHAPTVVEVELVDGNMKSEAIIAQGERDYELRLKMFEFKKHKFEVEGLRHTELVTAINAIKDNLTQVLDLVK